MDLTGGIVIGGILNSAILAVASITRRRRHPSSAWLCLVLALLSLGLASILTQHRVDGLAERLAVTLEHLAAYAVAPSVYFLARSSLGLQQSAVRQAVHYLPLILFVLAAAPFVMLGRIEPPPIQLTVGYMMAYTLASAILLGASHKDERTPLMVWPLLIVLLMTCVHLSQIARLIAVSHLPKDIVALAGSLSVFVIIGLALARATPWPEAKASRYSRSPEDEEQLSAHFMAMKTALEGGLSRKPDLKLGDLAAETGISTHRASQALSQAGKVTFHQLVRSHRVADAIRQLEDEMNAGVAIEAIGMAAGFRSRSTFYQSFREETGTTPAEYRRIAECSNSCPTPPARTRNK